MLPLACRKKRSRITGGCTKRANWGPEYPARKRLPQMEGWRLLRYLRSLWTRFGNTGAARGNVKPRHTNGNEPQSPPGNNPGKQPRPPFRKRWRTYRRNIRTRARATRMRFSWQLRKFLLPPRLFALSSLLLVAYHFLPIRGILSTLLKLRKARKMQKIPTETPGPVPVSTSGNSLEIGNSPAFADAVTSAHGAATATEHATDIQAVAPGPEPGGGSPFLVEDCANVWNAVGIVLSTFGKSNALLLTPDEAQNLGRVWHPIVQKAFESIGGGVGSQWISALSATVAIGTEKAKAFAAERRERKAAETEPLPEDVRTPA